MHIEYKNFDGMNNDIIEIVSPDTTAGLLNKSGNNNIKVFLPLMLCIGYFDNIVPINRKCLSKYYKNVEKYNFTNDFKNLKELANNCSKIRVWSSHLDPEDYCLLLLICYLFQDKNISVTFSEEFEGRQTINAIDKFEIHELEKKEHILTKLQKKPIVVNGKKL